MPNIKSGDFAIISSAHSEHFDIIGKIVQIGDRCPDYECEEYPIVWKIIFDKIPSSMLGYDYTYFCVPDQHLFPVSNLNGKYFNNEDL